MKPNLNKLLFAGYGIAMIAVGMAGNKQYHEGIGLLLLLGLAAVGITIAIGSQIIKED